MGNEVHAEIAEAQRLWKSFEQAGSPEAALISWSEAQEDADEESPVEANPPGKDEAEEEPTHETEKI